MHSDDDLINAANQIENSWISDEQLVQVLNEYENRQANKQIGSRLYNITSVNENENLKYKIKEITLNVEINNIQKDFFVINDDMNEMFEEIYNDYIVNLPDNIKIGIALYHDLFIVGDVSKPIWTNYVEKTI